MANWYRSLLLIILGGILGGCLVLAWEHSTVFAQREAPQANSPTPASLQGDVARLKDLVPPNSHPMVEVGLFATNLWFAAQKKNWPLTTYYMNEMRNRIRWEVHLNPGPKGADGNPVDMQAIFDGIDNGSLATLKKTIDMKDSKQFATDYKRLLEDCYSCHKAANRPYLRLMVPVSGAQPIINLDPDAAWPQ
jgi:hypothetical protein